MPGTVPGCGALPSGLLEVRPGVSLPHPSPQQSGQLRATRSWAMPGSPVLEAPGSPAMGGRKNGAPGGLVAGVGLGPGASRSSDNRRDFFLNIFY